jgi:hypothetical protein
MEVIVSLNGTVATMVFVRVREQREELVDISNALQEDITLIGAMVVPRDLHYPAAHCTSIIPELEASHLILFQNEILSHGRLAHFWCVWNGLLKRWETTFCRATYRCCCCNSQQAVLCSRELHADFSVAMSGTLATKRKRIQMYSVFLFPDRYALPTFIESIEPKAMNPPAN